MLFDLRYVFGIDYSLNKMRHQNNTVSDLFMSKPNNNTLLENEDLVDDRCVEFIVLRDGMGIAEVQRLENNLHVNRKHVCQIMKRQSTAEEVELNGTVLELSLKVPVREMLTLKQHYKVEWIKARRRSLMWGFVSCCSLIALAYSILMHYEIV